MARNITDHWKFLQSFQNSRRAFGAVYFMGFFRRSIKLLYFDIELNYAKIFSQQRQKISAREENIQDPAKQICEPIFWERRSLGAYKYQK